MNTSKMNTRENNLESQSESQRAQQQDVNPESLLGTDEQQRITARDLKDQKQELPVGNEQDSQETEGAKAGIGE